MELKKQMILILSHNKCNKKLKIRQNNLNKIANKAKIINNKINQDNKTIWLDLNSFNNNQVWYSNLGYKAHNTKWLNNPKQDICNKEQMVISNSLKDNSNNIL